MTPPNVSVIIVTWNTRDLLRDCIDSLYRDTTAILEVIVVDNASADGTATMLRTEYPHVRLIANQRNLGFAAANNQGLRASTGTYILLLNPDTVILDNALDRSLAYLRQHPDIACLGPRVYESETVTQRTCFRFSSLWREAAAAFGIEHLIERLGGPEATWMPNWDRATARDVDVVSGMFMLAPRTVVEQIGLLDEAYFVYGEEADWCFRMHRAGLKRRFWPGACILHVNGGGQSTSQCNTAMYVQLQRSLLLFHRTHRGRLSELALRALSSAKLAVRCAVGVLLIAIRRPQGALVVKQSLAALRLHTFESLPPTRAQVPRP